MIKIKFSNYLGLYFQKKKLNGKALYISTLYDEVLQIHISKLKEYGYIDPEQIKSGTLNWSRNGNPQAVF